MVACDSLSRLEIEAESKIVNPILKDLSGSMKKIIKHKVLFNLKRNSLCKKAVLLNDSGGKSIAANESGAA